MTLKQLLSEVYALGFDESEGLNDSFVFAVNRALKMIFTELAPSVRAKITVDIESPRTIDVRDHFKDVMIVTSAPKDEFGRIIPDAYCDGYILTLPDSFTGDVVILYKPMPKELTVDSEEEKIDLPPFASHLLPLLVASFVFLDDDEEKADYYMTLYRHEVIKLTRRGTMAFNNAYTDVTGWA